MKSMHRVSFFNEFFNAFFYQIFILLAFLSEIELYRRKTVHVKSNEGAGLSFMVKPKKVGPITIKVTARTPRAGDGVERILQVEPEGMPLHENLAMLIDLRDKTEYNSNFTFTIPKNAVADSTKIEISAVGEWHFTVFSA